MKRLKGLLLLYCAEGFLAVAWIFLTPSESGKAVLLWLSPERVLLLGISLGVWAAIVATSFLLWRSPKALEAVQASIDRFCTEEHRLGSLLIFLVVIPAVLLAAVLPVIVTPLQYSAYRAWAPDTFPLLHALVLGFLPLLLLGILMALESAIYLALYYRQPLASRDSWSWARVGPPLLALLIVIVTAFHWLILIFQLRFFVNNPAWYWKFEPVSFNPGDLAFLLGGLLLLVLGWWALLLRHHVRTGLLLVFLLGWFLQLGVGLMSGAGFASFLDRYFSTYHKTYIAKASASHEGLLESIRRYEELYGSQGFTNTKPPGLMAFYIGLDHLVNGYPSDYPDDVRHERLSSVIAYTFPVIAMCIAFALYAFTKRYVPGRLGLVPTLSSLLLVLCPNLVLFSLFPDQAIYPLLFLLGVTLVIVAVQRQSIVLSFVLGLFLYIAVFFAFTMLPLYPFAGLYLILSYWFARRERPFSRALLMGLAIAAGTLLLYFLCRALVNYDFLPRFEKTIAINHNFDFYLRVKQPLPTASESFSTRLTQIVGAAWLNNLDFAAAIGFAIYILFAVQGFRLMKRLWERNADSGDIIMAALLLSFVVLNLAGTAQGEVPRLWLFWLPMILVLAALELEPFAQRHPRLFLGLALMQFITIFLTFHFQDLRM